MNPLDLRVSDEDLAAIDPLERARARMCAGEEREAAAEEARVLERREAAELAAQRQHMSDRIEIWQRGYVQRHADAALAQARAQRQAQAAELYAQADKLLGRGDSRPLSAADVAEEQLLKQHRDGQDAWSAGACMRARIASAEAAHRAALGAAGPVVSRSGGARREPGPRRSLPDGPPPLSAPQYSHLLPAGDW
jgi:hypothetical protein